MKWISTRLRGEHYISMYKRSANKNLEYQYTIYRGAFGQIRWNFLAILKIYLKCIGNK